MKKRNKYEKSQRMEDKQEIRTLVTVIRNKQKYNL